VHYYVAAYADGPKPTASKGSSGSPNIIEISGVAAAGGGKDNEDPIKGGGGGGGGGGGSVSSNVTVGGPKRARVLIAVAGGAGSGYVAGETEGMNMVKNCCFGGPIVVLQPELGYFVNPKLSIGAAARIGIPVGANVEGHATAAPGGVLRVRYAISQGPLLVGGGVGFTRKLSGSVSVMADLSALAGIAVVKSIGPAPVLNNGFGIDLSLGIQLGL